MVSRVDEFLRSHYKPTDEEAPDEVLVAVSRTVGTILLTFMLLSHWRPDMPIEMYHWLNQDTKRWVPYATKRMNGYLNERGLSRCRRM